MLLICQNTTVSISFICNLFKGSVRNSDYTVLDNWRISNTEIVERFRSEVLSMIVDAPRYVIRRDLQTSTAKGEIRHYSSQYRARPKRPSGEPHGATRQQAIAETPAK
jgi:hypothetical protein